MSKVSKAISAVLSIPKTLYFNLRVFNFKDALRLPVLICYKSRIKKVFRGCIKIEAPLSFAMIRIGFGGTPCVPKNSSELLLSEGVIVFSGEATFSSGVNIRNNGIIHFGKDFCSNSNFRITCGSEIKMGDNVLFGWNSSIRDSNGHPVYVNGKAVPNNIPVIIGNHVWIGAESHILRGTVVHDNSIIGFGSIVSGKFMDENVIIAGNPARIIKENAMWDY